MPFVNIKITRDGATAGQKAALVRGVTDLLVQVLGKNPATTVVVIDEVDTDNWGAGGESITIRRKRGGLTVPKRWDRRLGSADPDGSASQTGDTARIIPLPGGETR